MMNNRSGMVLLFCLMMLGVITMLSQQLVRGVYIGSQFVRTMVERERAEMLALSGITIAMAQLSPTLRDEERKELAKQQGIKEEDLAKVDEVVPLLRRVLPHLNRWRDYELKEEFDGIDGKIRVCVVCEQGKINLNEAFDFKKMEFKPEYELLLKALEVPNIMKQGELHSRLVEFFKKRKRKLDDLSELLAIQDFDKLDMFYNPPRMPAQGKKAEPNKDLTVQDIFTIWSPNDKLDLLWLPDALCAIFGMRRPHANDASVLQERYLQFFESFKKDLASDWDANWKNLEPLYDQKPKVISELKNIFTKEFGPRVFSVLSCGTVGRVEQQILAVIRYQPPQKAQTKQKNSGEPDEQSEEEDEGVQSSSGFKILRVYWL